MPKRCDRADDDRDLKLLGMHQVGYTKAEIARLNDMPSSRVRTIINRVEAEYQASEVRGVQ